MGRACYGFGAGSRIPVRRQHCRPLFAPRFLKSLAEMRRMKNTLGSQVSLPIQSDHDQTTLVSRIEVLIEHIMSKDKEIELLKADNADIRDELQQNRTELQKNRTISASIMEKLKHHFKKKKKRKSKAVSSTT